GADDVQVERGAGFDGTIQVERGHDAGLGKQRVQGRERFQHAVREWIGGAAAEVEARGRTIVNQRSVADGQVGKALYGAAGDAVWVADAVVDVIQSLAQSAVRRDRRLQE